jgi:hypothetical protein
MSKKAVKVRKSYVKQWFAVISGSLFASAMQAAQAAHDADRPSFRDFREQNGGIDRRAVRQMYRQEFGIGRGANPGVSAIPAIGNTGAGNIPVPSVNNVNQVHQHLDKLSRKLERQGVLNQSVQGGDGSLVSLRNGVNLDLGSATRNITLGRNLFDNIGSVEISVGGETKTVAAGSQVSAAEYIAVKQILAGSAQKILIDSQGSATGGEVDLGAITANNDVMRASDLVVPVNVTTIGDFSKRSDFRLLGDLTNAGTVFTSGNGRNGGAIRADDIVNQAGAKITADGSLALFASGNLANYGSITSTGSVTLSAGNSLTNTGSVSAKNDVNLSASNINNSGSVQSLKGDINIDGPATTELNVNGAGGTFTAGGDINVRNSAYAGSFNTNVTSGDYFSRHFNLNAGNGILRADVNELTGLVNQTGSEAHLSASTDDLNIGQVCLTGDPTYKNDAGNININGNISVNEKLAFIASGNITSANNITISTSQATGGFDIFMAAGAAQSPGGTNTTTAPGTASGTTLTGLASSSGGSILLGSNVTIDTRGTGANTDGGDVGMFAFSGLNFNSGRVDIGNTTIRTGGNGTGSNGGLRIIAGAQNTTAIRLGLIDSTGGALETGGMFVDTAQPVINTGTSIVFDAAGNITSGNTLFSGTASTNGDIIALKNINSQGGFGINASGTLTLGAGAVLTSTSVVNTVFLTAGNGIVGGGNASLVVSPQIFLQSTSGDIGSTSNRLRIDADTLLVVNQNSSFYVNDIDDINVSYFDTGSTADLVSTGLLTVGTPANLHVADHISLRSTGDAVQIDANLTGIVDVRVRANGDVQTGLGIVINSPQTYLTSDTTSVNVTLSGGNLVVNSPNAILQSTGSINFAGGASSVAGTLQMSANGDLTTTSSVAATTVDFTTGQSFHIGSTVIGSSEIILRSQNDIVDSSLTGSTLLTPVLSLISQSNIGSGAANPLHIDANTLNAEALNVFVADPNSIILETGVASGSVFNVVAANSIISTPTSTTSAPTIELLASNGSFQLAGTVIAPNVKLVSGNSITNSGIGTVIGDLIPNPVSNLILESLNGSIGSPGAPVSINASNAKLNSSLGSVYFASPTSTLSINAGSGAGLDFNVSGSALNATNQITAGRNLTLNASVDDLFVSAIMNATNGSITFSAADDILLGTNATALGNITVNSGGLLTIGGPLTSTAGSINILANEQINLTAAILTAANSVSVSSTTQSVFVTNSDIATTNGDITISSGAQGVSIGGTSEIESGRDVFIASTAPGLGFFAFSGDALTGRNISFDVDSFNANKQIVATESILLRSNQSLLDINFSGSATQLSAPQIDLVVISGTIGGGIGNPLNIDAVNLTANAPLVNISDPNSINIGNGPSNASTLVGAAFIITAVDDITVSGTIGSGNYIPGPLSPVSVTLTAGGDLIIGADVKGQTVNLNSTDNMTTINSARVITNSLNLTSTNGNIGVDTSNRFQIQTFDLTVNSGGSAFVNAAVSPAAFLGLELRDASVVTGTFDLLSVSNVNLIAAQTLTAGDIVITVPTGFVNLTGTTTGTNSVTLTTGGPLFNLNFTGLAFTPTLNLTSIFSNVGDNMTPVVVNATNFSGNASGIGGTVVATSAGALNIVGTNSAPGVFSVSAAGALTTTGTINANNIFLTATGGNKVSVNSAATSSFMRITSSNGIVNADLTGPINTFGLDLNTTSGDINVTNVDVTALTFSSAGSMTFVDPNSVSIGGFVSTAATNINLTAATNLTSSASITSTGGSVSITATNGFIDLNDFVRANGTISLTSHDSILNSSIAGLDGGAGVPVQNLVLVSTAGDIGAAGGQANALTFDAVTVSANAAAGSVFLNDTGNSLFIDSSAALGAFRVWTSGSVTLNGTQTLVADALYINSATGGITFNGTPTIATSIELISLNNILSANFANPLSAPSITLTATGVGAQVNVSADFQNVSASATTVVLTDTAGSMNIGPGASTATTFTATAPVNISNDGTINATMVSLTATTGGFTFNNAISGITSITLTSFDDILNGTIAGQLITPTLTATSTNGDIGTALDPLTLNVDNVTLNAALGNVWVDNASPVNVIGASSAQGIFSLHADGLITVAATLSAANVDLNAKLGANHYVQINAAVNGSTSVTITSDDGILSTDGMNLISSPRINLVTTGGSIGSGANPVVLNTNVLSVQSANNVFVNDTDSVDLAASSAVAVLRVTAANNLTSSGTVSAADVVLNATGGSLTLSGLTRGTSSITLSSSGSILEANVVGGLDSGVGVPVNQLNLTSTAGSIGTQLDPLNVEVTNITANSTSGSVYLIDANAMNFGPGGSAASNAVGQAFVASAGGALTSTGAISGNQVALTAGDIFDLDGSVTAVTQLTLSSLNGIQNSNVSGGLISPTLSLTSTAGSIGAIGDRLLVDTNTLFASAATGSVFITEASAIVLRSDSVAAGVLSLTAGGALSVSNNGPALTAPTVVLFSGGTLTLNVGVSGSTGVELISLGAILQTAGTISGGALSLDYGAGPVTLTTNVASLTSEGPGVLTINEANGIQLLSQIVGTLNINASQLSSGNVTTGSDFTVGTLNIVNGNGNITIGNNVAATTAMTLNTSAGSGFIQQTGGVLTTPSLTVLAGSGGIGLAGNDLIFTNGANPVTLTANATGGGDISLVYAGTGTVNVQASAGNDFFTLDTTFGGNVVIAGAVSGTGSLNIITDDLTNNSTLTFDQISVSNPFPSGSVSITGGTFTTANGFSVLSNADINLSGNILMNGTGEASFSVGSETDQFIVNTGAVVTGVNRVTVYACDLVFNGVITGNPLVIVCDDNGTIANSLGDVFLPSDLVFVGQNLAILAAGNITTSGSASIDLSGPAGGGSLTLMAGYDFTPATGGQVQSGVEYTISGINPNGGSIDLTGVQINLNGGGGSGGSLLAVANTGTLNDGSIVLADIDTTGTNNGGSVTITGPGGITVGDINTIGGITSGNVTLSVAAPAIVGGPIKVQNGVLTQGSFGVGTATNGNILFDDVFATGANFTVNGALGATDSITQGTGSVTADRLFINTGVGTATVQVVANELNTSGNGVITVDELDSIALNSIVGALQSLSVNAGAGVSTGAASISIDALQLTASGGDIVLNGNVGGTTSVDLDSSGTITQSGGTISGGALTVNFVTGPVTLNTNVGSLQTISGTVLTINETSDLVLNNQGVDSLTINVTSGNITTASNFVIDDLTIGVVNGTIAVSNVISANNVADLFADDGITSTGLGVIGGATVILESNVDLGVDAANRLQINATTFQVDAQDAFVNNVNTSAATLNASIATGTLDVSTAGDLVSGGNYSAQVVALATGGAFNVTNTINGTTSISLTTDGDLTNVAGTLNTPTLLLNSVNGNVGTSAAAPFLVAANVASIGGSAGDGFFVTSAATDGVNFVAINAVGDISLKAGGDLNLTQNITSTNGAFAVQTTQDILDIADGITILAHDQIDIVNLGVEKKRDKIILGNGSSILTNAKTPGLGNVNILLGPAQSPGNKIPTPKKFVTIVETGGQALFGGKKAQAAAAGNVITAQGADVYISTFNPKSIVLEGNVIITADPPVAAGTQTVVRSFGNQNGTNHVPFNAGVNSTLSTDTLQFGADTTMSPLAVINPTAGFAVNNELRSLQLIPSNNVTSSLTNATNAGLATATVGGIGSLTVGNASADDSYISTSAPTSTFVDAKFCSDIELNGDGVIGSLSKVSHSACVTLNNGSVLFVPKSDTTVVTPKGRVKVAANAVAMIVVDENHLSVYDVNDQHKRSVVIEAGGRSIPLSPGKHAVITHAGVQQFADINPVEAVMHRGLANHDLGNGHKAFTSEFSVPSAISSIKPLAAIITSEHREARKVRDGVLKTSAVIMQLTQNGVAYELHTKPKTVALQW